MSESMFASEGITKSDRVLHTPGSFAKRCLLYVQEAGTLESLVPHVCRREKLDSYLIVTVLAGKGVIHYEGRQFELHKGECAWINCYEEFTHKSSEKEPWKLAWIHFNGNCAGEFYKLFRKRKGSPVFIPADLLLVQDLLKRVFHAVKNNEPELEAHSLLTQLTAACIRPLDAKGMMREVREYINANYKEKGLVSLVLQRFQTAEPQLEELFLNSFGIGLRDYILSRRFNAAKEQMRFTIHPVEEVIVESGIGNEDLFYQLFREHENMSPQEYRKSWAQWMKD